MRGELGTNKTREDNGGRQGVYTTVQGNIDKQSSLLDNIDRECRVLDNIDRRFTALDKIDKECTVYCTVQGKID